MTTADQRAAWAVWATSVQHTPGHELGSRVLADGILQLLADLEAAEQRAETAEALSNELWKGLERDQLMTRLRRADRVVVAARAVDADMARPGPLTGNSQTVATTYATQLRDALIENDREAAP